MKPAEGEAWPNVEAIVEDARRLPVIQVVNKHAGRPAKKRKRVLQIIMQALRDGKI